MRLKEILEKRFSEKDLRNVKGSFDIIGDVAVVEIPDDLEHRELDIVDALREVHPRIMTVYKKVGARKGKHRLGDFKLIYGEERKTEHKEHGYRIRIDPVKVYFSPRESTERQRIAGMVRPGETVMVMFAGAAPYSIAVAKKQPRVKKVYSVEMNPDAHKYAVENVRINKTGHKVVPVLGECNEICDKHSGECDRVVMPLPKGAYNYLRLASECLKKKGGWIHYYFLSAEDGVEDVKELIRTDVESFGRKVKSMEVRKASPYSPGTYKYCIDMELE